MAPTPAGDPHPDPDKTVPLPGRAAGCAPDLITLAAAKGLLDEATARARLGDNEPTVKLLVENGLLNETLARELVSEHPDALCPECGRPLRAEGRHRVCAPCGLRVSPERPSETQVRRLPPEVVEAMRDPANVFGRYIRLEELGRGGMGAVYLAYDRELSRRVALKIPKTLDADDLQRFKREALLAASLNHPNIVAIHEVGEAHGAMFLAMQLIEGESAAKREVEVRRAVEIVRDAARAVAYAHDRRVVHRDLKPENLMIDKAGRVYVMDFGLAREQEVEKSVSQSAILGTPSYMPPEQARGEPLDGRADVYALGATLYRLVTGLPPFLGKSAEIIKHVLEDEPIAPRRLKPSIPRDVEIMILKAMCKEKARRYAGATALAEDLDRWLKGDAITARPATWTYRTSRKIRRNPWAWAASAVAAVIAIVVAGYLLGDALVRAREVRRGSRRADELAAKAGVEELEEAVRIYDRLKARAPGNSRVARRYGEVSRELAVARLWRDVREAHARREEERRTAQESAARAAELEPGIQDWMPAEQKTELWEAQRRRDEAREAAQRAEERLTTLLAQVLALWPEDAEARRQRAELEWERYVRAREKGDERAMDAAAGVIREHDPEGRYAERLREIGTLTLATIPPGARATAYRYVQKPDRRLLPGDEPIDLGATPVGAELRRGSYLVILSHEGFRDVRYPIWIEAAETWEGEVRLLPEAEIGEGWIYVPAGKFQAGGDAQAPNAWAGGRREVGDFVISKYEVTMEEYEEFIRDLLTTDRAQAEARIPRDPTGMGKLWRIDGDRITYLPGEKWWPVIGVSWEDADAYCRWRSRKDLEWDYMLPTEEQWEKAARGVDGRYFPWGNHFDWSFTKGGDSREGNPQPEPIGTFEADESPYGVRDMGGSVYEWCADWYREGSTRSVRGGAWGHSAVFLFRLAYRTGGAPSFTGANMGFRLVRAPEGF